jgi:transposase
MVHKRPKRQTKQQPFHPNAAGIDCGATDHFVAVPQDRAPQPGRSFRTFTADLYALADWLGQCGIDPGAMESTGVYWIPLFAVLEARGFAVYLVEPGTLKHAPGRKTDVVDCQWIQQLHSAGLLSASFRPDDDSCMLRSSLRQRDMLVRYAAQHVQHMQKALMELHVQLHHVIDDITGLTGTRIIEAMLAGERAPERLAALRDTGCKNDAATIARALAGNWRDDHLFALQQAAELYSFYKGQLAQIDAQIEAYLHTFADHSEGQPLPTRRRQRKHKSNEPAFDMVNLLYRMSGVD